MKLNILQNHSRFLATLGNITIQNQTHLEQKITRNVRIILNYNQCDKFYVLPISWKQNTKNYITSVRVSIKINVDFN